ncbi:cytochrome b5 domain-containing protein [Geoalkalibacter sp.]|uniref:cytochrome b5 domain-containing protein n=1 Tax=Geoalkalibacter sp. TaxID=3041440 RepID=UPI00272EBA68|nr:cytochrome b5 domain-containing protein [Geoalkalibacter sp.]
MTLEELANFDGRDGRKPYVAVGGKVYDVSTSPLWEQGDHQGLHQAGADLTAELATAPHVRAVVERFPVVGTIEEPDPPKKKGLFGFLKK